MLLYETQNCKLIYDKEKNMLHQHWIGYTRPQLFQELIDKVVEIAHKHKIAYIISDLTEAAILKQESRDYAVSVMPKLMDLGLKKMAFLLPEKIFVELAAQYFEDKSNSVISEDNLVGRFATLDNAKKWLFEDN